MLIEIWSDVVCPWCYVGKRRLETALAAFEHRDEVEVVYRSFELDPTAPHHGHEPTTGVLARKYGRTEAEMREMQQQLVGVAAEEGLDFRLFDTVHTNTDRRPPGAPPRPGRGRPGAPARAQGGAARGVLRARRGRRRPRRAARRRHRRRPRRRPGSSRCSASDEYADAVQADIAQARAYGATGVPFFVVDQRFGVSGAQPAEVFGQVLEQAWAESRPRLQMVAARASACGPDGCAI